MIDRCETLKLRLVNTEDRAKLDFTVFLTVQTMNFIHGGGTRCRAMKKLRVLALMHDYLVPPDDVRGQDIADADWKTEYDVLKPSRSSATRCALSA